MTTNQPNELDEIRAILRTVAEQQARSQQQIDSNARSISANSDAIAISRADLRTNVEDLVSMISASAAQAEIDRAEFRATVQQILEALTQRFSSNGH